MLINNPWGESNQKGFTEWASEYQITIVGTEKFNDSDNDVSAQLSRLREAEAEVIAKLGATKERTKEMINQQTHQSQRDHHQRLVKVGELKEGRRENYVELPPLLISRRRSRLDKIPFICPISNQNHSQHPGCPPRQLPFTRHHNDVSRQNHNHHLGSNSCLQQPMPLIIRHNDHNNIHWLP